ncbi:MAG: ATPase, T2SS/T4P/T4SS family [Pirellulaceae bacterium]
MTGPTGSGKSTSLASLINFINETIDHHIITIEDPIEFITTTRRRRSTPREVGVDVPSFSEAIRRALRQDPDVILVGELRDLETIEAATVRRKPVTSCSVRCTPTVPKASSTASSMRSQAPRTRFAPSSPHR